MRETVAGDATPTVNLAPHPCPLGSAPLRIASSAAASLMRLICRQRSELHVLSPASILRMVTRAPTARAAEPNHVS